jgi:hypothetical protein
MHHDDAEPLSPAPNQTPHHIDTVPDVEAGSRVVRKQSRWIDREHHGEQDARALPTDGCNRNDCHAVLDQPQSSNVAGPRSGRAPWEA